MLTPQKVDVKLDADAIIKRAGQLYDTMLTNRLIVCSTRLHAAAAVSVAYILFCS